MILDVHTASRDSKSIENADLENNASFAIHSKFDQVSSVMNNIMIFCLMGMTLKTCVENLLLDRWLVNFWSDKIIIFNQIRILTLTKQLLQGNRGNNVVQVTGWNNYQPG